MEFKEIKMTADPKRCKLSGVLKNEERHREDISCFEENTGSTVFADTYFPPRGAGVIIILDREPSRKTGRLGYGYEMYAVTIVRPCEYRHKGVIEESAFAPALCKAQKLAEKFLIACLRQEQKIIGQSLEALGVQPDKIAVEAKILRIFGLEITDDMLKSFQDLDLEQIEYVAPNFMSKFDSYCDARSKDRDNEEDFKDFLLNECRYEGEGGLHAAVADFLSEVTGVEVHPESNGTHKYAGCYCTMPWGFDKEGLPVMQSREGFEGVVKIALTLLLKADDRLKFDFYPIPDLEA